MKTKPRFAVVFCSQCGGEFGPRDNGYSHCTDHKDDEIAKLRAILQTIANYDADGMFGPGICPYGCDCPNIARGA